MRKQSIGRLRLLALTFPLLGGLVIPSTTISASTSSSDVPHIPGLTLQSIQSLASDLGMTCILTQTSIADAPAGLSGIRCERSGVTGSPGDLLIFADYWAPDAVLLLFATTERDAALADTENFLADVASVPYDGADPPLARQFIAENIDNPGCVNPGCTRTIGSGFLVFQFGFGGGRILDLSPVDLPDRLPNAAMAATERAPSTNILLLAGFALLAAGYLRTTLRRSVTTGACGPR